MIIVPKNSSNVEPFDHDEAGSQVADGKREYEGAVVDSAGNEKLTAIVARLARDSDNLQQALSCRFILSI